MDKIKLIKEIEHIALTYEKDKNLYKLKEEIK